MDNVDNFLTAPMFGFKDVGDYRKQSSVEGLLHKIKVPCFYLHSWDDFVLGPLTIPLQEFEESENLILATTTAGGHCCHFGGGRLGGLLPTMWFSEPIKEYLRFIK